MMTKQKMKISYFWIDWLWKKCPISCIDTPGWTLSPVYTWLFCHMCIPRAFIIPQFEHHHSLYAAAAAAQRSPSLSPRQTPLCQCCLSQLQQWAVWTCWLFHDSVYSRAGNTTTPIDKAARHIWSLSHLHYNLLTVWMGSQAIFNAAAVCILGSQSSCSSCLSIFPFSLIDSKLALVVCRDYRQRLDTLRTIWDSYLVMSLNNWSLLWINQKHGCSVDAPALVVVMLDGIMWLSGRVLCPDFPPITLQDYGAVSRGGREDFSAPVSLH